MNRPYRVLIADDEKLVATGLQGQLESLGYDVVAVVHDGQHAIEVVLVAGEGPGCVVVGHLNDTRGPRRNRALDKLLANSQN